MAAPGWLLLPASDFQGNQAADDEYHQRNGNDRFQFHKIIPPNTESSRSYFTVFLPSLRLPTYAAAPRAAAPIADTPIRAAHSQGLLSSPVFGVSRSSLCISATVVLSAKIVTFLSAGST